MYGPREVLDSDDDDKESDVERARRESMRSYNEEEVMQARSLVWQPIGPKPIKRSSNCARVLFLVLAGF